VSPAYDIHPEFGYFCPAPRMRRELRVAVVSILAGMAIGAAIMAIHAGQAAETEAVAGNAQLESSAPDPLAAAPAASPRVKDADNAKADPVETIKPHPTRIVSRAKKRPGAMHARRHRDDENENARWQDRRWPNWDERAYAEDRYGRGAYRNWVH
jgi:hypothetical protein